jgi:hypothetical protein
MVLTVSFVLFPVTMLGCHRRSSDSLRPATLAPASERQNHTTSPSAQTPLVRARIALGDVRPSHPIPNVRDDREAPLLWERDSANCKFDLGQTRSGIFSRAGLDRVSHAEGFLPVGQINRRADARALRMIPIPTEAIASARFHARHVKRRGSFVLMEASRLNTGYADNRSKLFLE